MDSHKNLQKSVLGINHKTILEVGKEMREIKVETITKEAIEKNDYTKWDTDSNGR